MRTVTFNTQIHDGIIRIPERYKNLETKDIEVILMVKSPSTEKPKKSIKPGKKARGILSNYKNPALISREKATIDN